MFLQRRVLDSNLTHLIPRMPLQNQEEQSVDNAEDCFNKVCSTAVTAVISITNSEHCSKENLCLQGKGPGPHASKLSERNARVMLDFLISISIVYSLYICSFLLRTYYLLTTTCREGYLSNTPLPACTHRLYST